MCAHHIKFVARTVLVRNNDVEAAYRALDRLVGWSIGDGSLMRTVTRGLSKNRRDRTEHPSSSISSPCWRDGADDDGT